jgi:hypothetical protein
MTGQLGLLCGMMWNNRTRRPQLKYGSDDTTRRASCSPTGNTTTDSLRPTCWMCERGRGNPILDGRARKTVENRMARGHKGMPITERLSTCWARCWTLTDVRRRMVYLHDHHDEQGGHYGWCGWLEDDGSSGLVVENVASPTAPRILDPVRYSHPRARVIIIRPTSQGAF